MKNTNSLSELLLASEDMEQAPLRALLHVMERLRDPNGGCPWDLEQNFKTIAPYTIEEAYEVADAIDREDFKELKEELGDLLMQVVYHAQMAKEENLFDFNDIARTITAKMIHRHPHVFGDNKSVKTAADVNAVWEERKDQEEKRRKLESLLDDVPRALPALKHAQKLQKRAASAGFEWPEAIDVLDKFEEEIGELREAIREGRQEEIIDELGDMFFVLTNFGRKLGIDCEESLRQASLKFEHRFKGMEFDLKENNKTLFDIELPEMEDLWQAQKKKERKGQAS